MTEPRSRTGGPAADGADTQGVAPRPLEVGDVGVVITGRSTRETRRVEVTVVKVGRKWAYVEPSWLGRCDRVTGVFDQNYGTPPVFYTPERMAQADRVSAANERIKESGINPWDLRNWSGDDRLALAVWLDERFGEMEANR